MLRSVGSSGSKLSSDIFLVCSFLLLQLKITSSVSYSIDNVTIHIIQPAYEMTREKKYHKEYLSNLKTGYPKQNNFTSMTLSYPQTLLNVLSANGFQENLFVNFHWRAQYELLE